MKIIPVENLAKYKTVTIHFTLASLLSKCISAKLSTNLIIANVFNPNRELFSFNLQTPYVYINREFKSSNLLLNDSFLDFITFELNITKDENHDFNFPSLEFKIELDLHEN